MSRLLLATLLLAAFSASALAAAPSAEPSVERTIDSYYAEWTQRNPLAATELGIHAFDHELPDVRAESEAAWAARLKFWRSAVQAGGQASDCDAACRIDARTVVFFIERELFEIETYRPHARQPGHYVDVVTEAVYPIIKRTFAPSAVRAADVIARLKKIPAMLTEGRKRLDATLIPPLSVTITLEELGGAVAFVRDDVPAAFPGIREQAAVRTAAAVASRSLADYGVWLKKELLPKASAPVALGAPLLADLLTHEEMIDAPVDALLARSEGELHRLQAEFTQVAKTIDPTRPARAVQAALGEDHPSRDGVLAEVRAALDRLRTFIIEHHIVEIPSPVLPIVDETPPFLRAVTQASMDTPGPYEEHAKEAYFHVTLPDPSWAPARIENFLAGALSRSTIDVLAIHEAYPGHYLQALWAPRLTRRARRMEGVSSNVEGWAHYCEAMMIEQGFGKDSPRTHLAQITDALLRAARYVVTMRLHTGRMTVEEAQRFFVDEGYQTEEVARIEAKRGVTDPYLYYTWGKLEILKLREEAKKKWGAGYTLERFHDAFLAEGAIPLPLLREALLAR